MDIAQWNAVLGLQRVVPARVCFVERGTPVLERNVFLQAHSVGILVVLRHSLFETQQPSSVAAPAETQSMQQMPLCPPKTLSSQQTGQSMEHPSPAQTESLLLGPYAFVELIPVPQGKFAVTEHVAFLQANAVNQAVNPPLHHVDVVPRWTSSLNSSVKTASFAAARPLGDFCKIGSLCFTGTCLQKCNVGVNTGATPCNCNNHVARPDYYCRDSITALPIPACGRSECKGPSWECACDKADETCFATVPLQNGTLTHGACYKACPTVEPFSSSECLCNGAKCPTGSVCANGICNYGNTTFLVISQDFNAITKTLSLVLGGIPNDTNHIVSEMKGASDYPGFSTNFVGTYLVNQGVENQFIFPEIALENCGDTVVVQFMAQICLVDTPQTISSVGSCRPNSPTLQKSFTITATTTSTCAIALVVNSFSVEGMVQDINTGSSVILLADNVWQFVLHSSELQEAGMYIDVLSVSLNDKAASVLMDATCFTLVNAGFGTSTFTTTARVMNNTLTSYKDVAESGGARLVCSGPQRGFLLAKKEAGVTYTFSFDLGFGASIPPTSIGGGGSSGTGGTMQPALKRRAVTMSNELPSGSRVALSANVGSTLVRSNSSNPDSGSLNAGKGLTAGQIVGVVGGVLIVICVFGLVAFFVVKRLRPSHVEKGAVDVNELALGGRQGQSANNGLQRAIDALHPVHNKYKHGITHADLWSFAGAVAVNTMGGPSTRWKPGRNDYSCLCQAKLENHTNNIPNPKDDWNKLKETFGRMSFSPTELGVLSFCGHILGRAHSILRRTYVTVKLPEGGESWQSNIEVFPGKIVMTLPSDTAIAQNLFNGPDASATFSQAHNRSPESRASFFSLFQGVFARLLDCNLKPESMGHQCVSTDVTHLFGLYDC
ncbi:hypothetical protein BJ741DRAFT_667322 [Chytriomyces cf. hyalinus JEL632]|nr:hypothetical protein BJ741DRAFT_667322 [Chytriomyces cf. hyalinus JEL632]